MIAKRWILGVLLMLCSACDDQATSAPSASGSSSTGSLAQAAASNSAPPAHSSLVPRVAPAATPQCRLMAVTGAVKLGDAAAKQGELTAGEKWLELAKGERVDVQHTASARQWSVMGPARLRACPRGEEDVWLAYGDLKSGSGSGMRPGAQVRVATPQGSVWWGDTKLTLKVTRTETAVAVETGNALLAPAPGSTLKGKAEVQATQQGKLLGPPADAKRSEVLVKACEESALQAAKLAQEVLAPTNAAPAPSSAGDRATRGNLGTRARDHAESRGKARKVCAEAWASVGAGDAKGGPLSALEGRLEAADTKWREVPMPARKAPSAQDKGE
ncbi:MAG: hypothetical protein H6718_17045 [Polyangiaceae bacterium]|nr:hypothetical protein [Myxococcales bacterium]MCB9587108.1 hypothetical protein [Polyangiaceae bacterium]MCB9609517.1 hypothetical protein [Polyangiaceae bacterium]